MSKQAIIFTILVLTLVSIASCHDPMGSPTGSSALSPNDAMGSLAGGVTTARGLQAGTLTGRVTHALDGSSLAGLSVEVGGLGSRTTGSDGSFSLDGSGSTTVPVVVSGEGFHPRETRASLVSSKPIEIDLLPQGDGFDLDFFDHVFRNLGADGTERWTAEPQFEIWTKACECRAGEYGDCGELFVTEEDAPGQFVKLARDVIAADTTKYTGGFVRGSSVTTKTPIAGALLPWQDHLVPGKIIVVFMSRMDDSDSDASFAWIWPRRSGAIHAASIYMNRKHKDIPYVYSHELAHTMGFHHPVDYDRVPLPSTMRDFRDGPTRPDMLHGRILYRRPPGSSTPDIDPETYRVNQLRAEPDPPDHSRLRVVRN